MSSEVQLYEGRNRCEINTRAAISEKIETLWCKSYLKNRKQYTFLNGLRSTVQTVSCGVPQGSVLGPLVFLIYINDIPYISNIISFFLFADDTNAYLEAESLSKLEKTVNIELKKFYTWQIVNRLSLNIEKVNFAIFHPYNKTIKENNSLLINKKTLKEKNEIKYLGVIIDLSISWKAHIDKITKPIERAIDSHTIHQQKKLSNFVLQPHISIFTLRSRSMGLNK